MEHQHQQPRITSIILDQHANPLAEIIYRCALCRKLCDSASDALNHYQLDHIEQTKLQLSQQQQLQLQQQQQNINNHSNNSQQLIQHNNARSNQHSVNNLVNQLSQNAHLVPIGRQQQYNQQGSNLIKRQQQGSANVGSMSQASGANSSGGQMLRRGSQQNTSAATTASNNILKRASNVMRSSNNPYQSSNSRSNQGNRRVTANSINASNNNNSKAIDPAIHRQYTTTSASRAAKRYSAAAAAAATVPSSNSDGTGSRSSGSQDTPNSSITSGGKDGDQQHQSQATPNQNYQKALGSTIETDSDLSVTRTRATAQRTTVKSGPYSSTSGLPKQIKQSSQDRSTTSESPTNQNHSIIKDDEHIRESSSLSSSPTKPKMEYAAEQQTPPPGSSYHPDDLSMSPDDKDNLSIQSKQTPDRQSTQNSNSSTNNTSNPADSATPDTSKRPYSLRTRSSLKKGVRMS